MCNHIKLMADYFSHPLWWTCGSVGNIDPKTLPLSDGLIKELYAWAAKYDSILDTEYPPDSGFLSQSEQDIFENQGIELWKKLIDELAPDYSVIYHSYNLGRTFQSPQEIELL